MTRLGGASFAGRVGVALAALLVASPSLASNMAFAMPLKVGGAGQVRMILAVPLVYAPATAELLCQDIGGSSKVASVARWDDASSQFVTHPCGTGTNTFSLTPGHAYAILTAAGQSTDELVVGVHDDAFAYALPPTPSSNLAFVSIPYHHDIPDVAGAEGVVDAEDLCLSVGPGLWAVVRWDAAAGAYRSYACGSVFDTPFPIAPPEGVGLVNAAGQTIAWQPPHF